MSWDKYMLNGMTVVRYAPPRSVEGEKLYNMYTLCAGAQAGTQVGEQVFEIFTRLNARIMILAQNHYFMINATQNTPRAHYGHTRRTLGKHFM